tara:strand:- start:329 stop:460 length:132 start_codon:yes stop_codon:yes gene_type:complete
MKKAIKVLITQIRKAKENGRSKIFIQTLQQQLDKLINYGKKES